MLIIITNDYWEMIYLYSDKYAEILETIKTLSNWAKRKFIINIIILINTSSLINRFFINYLN